MWNGKRKAVTFSFDDGVTQDIRAIEILDKYGLKATFNLNTVNMGAVRASEYNGRQINRSKIAASDVKEIYKNHEIAGHTVTHRCLPTLTEEEIVSEVEDNRKALEELVGYEIRGMAYPCGGVNNDDRVAEIIRKHTKMLYARTITSSHSFDLQKNLLRFDPTVYYSEGAILFELAEKFLALKTDEPQLFYIWGHTYEMDMGGSITWEAFERLCRLISGKADIFYGTNSETLLIKE